MKENFGYYFRTKPPIISRTDIVFDRECRKCRAPFQTKSRIKFTCDPCTALKRKTREAKYAAERRLRRRHAN